MAQEQIDMGDIVKLQRPERPPRLTMRERFRSRLKKDWDVLTVLAAIAAVAWVGRGYVTDFMTQKADIGIVEKKADAATLTVDEGRISKLETVVGGLKQDVATLDAKVDYTREDLRMMQDGQRLPPLAVAHPTGTPARAIVPPATNARSNP